MISFSRVATAERACPCSTCQRRRRLESKLDVARDVLASRRLFVIGLDGVLFADDKSDLKEMIAALEDAIEMLGDFDHRSRGRRRRTQRTIGRFMQRSTQVREV